MEDQNNESMSVGDRPIPLRARCDLIIEQIGFQGAGYRIIKDPIALRYHRLQPEQFKILEVMQENRSLKEIRNEIKRAFPTIPVRIADVQHIIGDLHEKNLLISTRTGQGRELMISERKRKWKEIWGVLKNFLFLRLPGVDPEPLLKFVYPLTRWMFRPWAVTISIAFAISALLLVSVQFNEFRSRLPEFQQFFGWPNVMYMWFTIAIAKILHEFGHAVSCKHFGGECHKIGLMLLVFSPTLYCDVSDSWMMKNKWHRIAIGGAGAFVEVILSSIAIYVWWYSDPGLLNHLCLNLFFVTTVSTVIFNLNPLMRFDGYYMLSDYLEIPNMQQKSSSAFSRVFAWYVLGIRLPEDPFLPHKDRIWFAAYAVAAWIYKWMIVIGIAFFLYTVLKPYDLHNIGLILGISSLGTMLYGMGKSLYQILKMPRQIPISRPKLFTSIAITSAVVVAIMMIPVPWWIQPSFVLEPHNVHHVYAQVDGQVVKVDVTPGDFVKNGQLLVQMKNPDLQGELIRLERDLAIAQVEAKSAKANGNQDELLMIENQIESVSNQLEKINQQIEDLSIYSPSDGYVVEAEAIPAPKKSATNKNTYHWHGTPINPRNIGVLLEAGTPVLSIAPNKKMQAVMLVQQDSRNDLKIGETVNLRCYHLPDYIYEGKVASFSDRQSDFAPKSLSNKVGGDLPTTSDSQGRELLTDISYQATVLIDQETELLKTGMRGRALFVISKRSLGSWIWRSIRQTFNFRL